MRKIAAGEGSAIGAELILELVVADVVVVLLTLLSSFVDAVTV